MQVHFGLMFRGRMKHPGYLERAKMKRQAKYVIANHGGVEEEEDAEEEEEEETNTRLVRIINWHDGT
ncbi:unnamed protein product [Schistocephalus solidus]|uniref:Uncharacterized protein n=1 Tax=Schistocephalus solidus TaxID=70667 RepID=A0A183T052_SCHSO|nr:unnamed protein product [Schistocephalus solidus]